MPRCPKCRHKNPDNYNFCSQCGAKNEDTRTSCTYHFVVMGSGGVGKSAITIRFVNRQFEAKVMFFELIAALPIRNWRNYLPRILVRTHWQIMTMMYSLRRMIILSHFTINKFLNRVKSVHFFFFIAYKVAIQQLTYRQLMPFIILRCLNCMV